MADSSELLMELYVTEPTNRKYGHKIKLIKPKECCTDFSDGSDSSFCFLQMHFGEFAYIWLIGESPCICNNQMAF